MTDATGAADVDALAYDEAFAEYQRVVSALEAGGRRSRRRSPCTSARRPPAPLRAAARRGRAPRPAADGRPERRRRSPVDVRPEDAAEA